MLAALAYHPEYDVSIRAANDNIPLASTNVIRMTPLVAAARLARLSTASRRGLYSQYGPRSRAGFLLAMECPLDTPFDSERYRAPCQPLEALNARLQPERLLAQDGAVKALDLTYGYDLNGRITSQTNGVDSNHSRTYGYDRAGRLKTATSPAFGAGSFSYDALGNLRSKVMNGRTVTNSYDAKNRLTASHDNGTSRTVAYDNRGNITTLGNLGFVYDRADQPIVVSSGVNGNYTYDGNLKRVKAVVDGKTIYNVYDFAGRLAHVDEVTDGKETDYLHGMGQTIARIQNNNFTYLHPDHLGSAQSGTDRHGNVLWTEHYTPFGEALVNNAANDNQGGFTSHIKDKATGLNYMQARYYDPGIGRFLSVDPVGFMVSRPGQFNRYSYCYNDPVNCTDPTGMLPPEGTVSGELFSGHSLEHAQGISDAFAPASEAGAKGAMVAAGMVPAGRGVKVGLAARAGIAGRLGWQARSVRSLSKTAPGLTRAHTKNTQESLKFHQLLISFQFSACI